MGTRAEPGLIEGEPAWLVEARPLVGLVAMTRDGVEMVGVVRRGAGGALGAPVFEWLPYRGSGIRRLTIDVDHDEFRWPSEMEAAVWRRSSGSSPETTQRGEWTPSGPSRAGGAARSSDPPVDQGA